MDAVRVKSTRIVAAALLNKRDVPPTDPAGRVLARGHRPCFCTERHRARDVVHPSQRTLLISSPLRTRIGVWTDNRAERGRAVPAARVKADPPSFANGGPIGICSTRHDSVEPQFLLPSAGWQSHTCRPARSDRLPGAARRPARSAVRTVTTGVRTDCRGARHSADT